jgi:hypothetical protein
LFTLFKFGPDVTIQIDTKQRSMRERMVSVVIDYQKMRKADRFEIEKIGNPLIDTTIFPDPASQGTRILIKNVGQQFWDSCTVPTTHELKREIQEEIAEKYTMYLHGMALLKDTLLKCRGVRTDLLENIQDPKIGMDSLPAIEIMIDAQSMRNVSSNRVVSRMATIAGRQCDEQSMEDAADTTLNDESAGELSRPCWYTSWKVETKTGSSAAMAHVSNLQHFFVPLLILVSADCAFLCSWCSFTTQ